MDHQIELGYLRVEVADPAALGSYFTGIVGLELIDKSPLFLTKAVLIQRQADNAVAIKTNQRAQIGRAHV